MTSVLVALIVVGGTLWLGVRVATEWVADREADRAHAKAIADTLAALDARRVTVAERDIALREKQAEKPAPPAEMPQDLKDRILAWDDEFAKTDEEATLRQLFAIYGDWDIVRQKLVPLPARDAAAREQTAPDAIFAEYRP